MTWGKGQENTRSASCPIGSRSWLSSDSSSKGHPIRALPAARAEPSSLPSASPASAEIASLRQRLVSEIGHGDSTLDRASCAHEAFAPAYAILISPIAQSPLENPASSCQKNPAISECCAQTSPLWKSFCKKIRRWGCQMVSSMKYYPYE